MKNKYLLVGLLLWFNVVFSQADKVVGYWLTENNDAQVQIYKGTDNKYHGRMVWLKEPREANGELKTDTKNPDEKLKSRTLLNLVFIHNFEYDKSDNRWENGKIYDPESGNTYSCYIWFENNNFNVLYLKGYLGISLLGRTTKWTREDTLRK
ncbi:MAG: DUF2147 domain-containing protein [Bacteroidales bacterium]